MAHQGVLFLCENLGGMIIITGRISGVYVNMYKVITEGGEVNCRLPGSFELRAKKDMPAVGDFVMMNENHIITEILPRKNEIVRKTAGRKPEEQILAANIDHAFIVTSMNNEFNPRRIERYIAFLDTQNITCHLVLTKADLCDDAEFYRHQAYGLGLDEENGIIITSTVDGTGMEHINNMLTPGKTAVFIGSSGVGKSSIINYLMQKDVQATKAISGGDKDYGSHTTTHRELFMLPSGAAIIDTPGMREVQFWGGSGQLSSFADIDDLAADCKFRDCKHSTEPGCAVKKAIKDGALSADRLKSHNKLQREAEAAKMREQYKERSANKSNRKH